MCTIYSMYHIASFVMCIIPEILDPENFCEYP